MPNVDDLKTRQAARQLRKEQREVHVVKAHDQDAKLSDIQAGNQQRTAIASEAAAATKERNDASIDKGIVPEPAKRKPTRTETTRVQKIKHAREAERDARNIPAELDVDKELEKWNGEGSPPLHILNAVAEQADKRIRDEGRDIAQAAGKGAYEAYVGKVVGKRSRHAHMRAQVAAGEMQIALRKKPDAE